MKRTVLSLIFVATICLLSFSAGAQQQSAKDDRLPAGKKVLIVYLSRTNNTKAIAEIIHQKVGGRMVALIGVMMLLLSPTFPETPIRG